MNTKIIKKATIAAIVGFTLLSSEIVLAQQVFVYPQRGQSRNQENRDRSECDNWARQQTGGPPVANNNNVGGQILRGSARGAAKGAVGGAILGNAGGGAGAGAAIGGMSGIFNANDNSRQARDQQNRHNQAFASCMQGRGYSVTFGN